MTPPSDQPARLLKWMESLADPTRLRLLRLLERHELGVAELCDILQLPQSTVSRHLKLLADESWVRGRRQGTNHLYRTLTGELDTPAKKLWQLAREQTDNWPATKHDRLRLDRLLSQKQDDTTAFFAGAAAEWDKLRSELYGQAFSVDAMLALVPPTTIVADLACGTAPIAARVAPFVEKVIAIDNSPAMLKAAKKRTQNIPNIDLRKGDLTNLPIEDASVDAALLILALTYVPDPAPVLNEMSRILKTPGQSAAASRIPSRAVIIDLLPHDRTDFQRQMGQTRPGLDPKDLDHLLKQSNFTNIHSRALPPEPSAKGPALFLTTAQKI